MRPRDLLFEIGCEEIPARFMPSALQGLKQSAEEDLAHNRLAHGVIQVYGTPRRLVLYIHDLEPRQKDMEAKFRGPQRSRAYDTNGKATEAALGFAKGKNIDPTELTIENIDGVEYVFAVMRESGKNTEELLPGILSLLIKRLVFPKNMYWKNPSVRFARPVRWLLALWGESQIHITLDGLDSGKKTRGHRFWGASEIEILRPEEYIKKLEDAFVIVDPQRRRAMICNSIASIENEIGGKVDIPPLLLEENVFLVEYPIPFYGSFDKAFLDIPEEVLITSMQKNQRYFPVRSADGRLMPNFIGVSNNQARDMSVVRSGNEHVLRARLYDAAFFWKEDQGKKLADRVSELERVIYQEELGSVLEKVTRVRVIANWLTEALNEPAIKSDVDRAAYLAKADQVTGMVYEFPEVQGIMGREYAKKSGEPDRVALALYEQYLPRFAGDELPTDKVGAILGMAERADTLVAIHKIGLAPTGSQDPYALRRAVRCINELIWGLELDISIYELIECAAKQLSADTSVVDRIMDFIRQRTQVQLRERGYGHGMVNLALNSQSRRPLQVLKMLQVLNVAENLEWFTSLILASVRVKNLLSKAGEEVSSVDVNLFTSEAERVLYKALEQLRPKMESAVKHYDWRRVNELLNTLSSPISQFFDEVMVMDPDEKIRGNRLALLKQCKEMFDLVGDFSLLKK